MSGDSALAGSESPSARHGGNSLEFGLSGTIDALQEC